MQSPVSSEVGAVYSENADDDELLDLFSFLETPANCVVPSFSRQRTMQAIPEVHDQGVLDPDDFEQPCQPWVTSGGTAHFYAVRYKVGRGEPIDKYIGKDFGRTADEFDFYQKMKAAAYSERCWYDFIRIAPECPGVVHLECDSAVADPSTTWSGQNGPGDSQTHALLLLENMHSGFKKMRFIDLKLGEETAVAGWKGKSRLRAQVNSLVDWQTNSSVEGFRLEGSDNPPSSLEQYLQLSSKLVMGQTWGNILSERRARRFCMQRLRGSDILNYWLSLQADEPDSNSSSRRKTESENKRAKEQYVHEAIWQTIDEVCRVLEIVLAIPVPQMWIGSSLGLQLEVGDTNCPPVVKVKVFDWGRSDMTLAGEYLRLTAVQKKEHISHWRQYLRALLHFQFELLRLAAHRCCCRQWEAIVCELCVEQQSISNVVSVAGDVICCGVRELLPVTGPPMSARRVRLPLKVRGIQVPCATVHLMVKIRKVDANLTRLRFEVRALENVANVVQQQRPDIEVVTLRLTAFENMEDAKKYEQGWHEGNVEGMHPIGRAFSQKTKPMEFGVSEGVGVAVPWNDTLEFMSFGDMAEEHERRLTNISFPVVDVSMIAQSMVMTPTRSNHDLCMRKLVTQPDQTWPSHLPPTICPQKEVDAAAKAFKTWIAAHSLDDGPKLPTWD